MVELLDRKEFADRLRAVGMSRYHDKHPFHRHMNAGRLTQGQVRGWVVNRFYYQSHIPIKDAAILSNCPVRELRRAWLHRITDHDGIKDGEGGIEKWLRLAEACGLTRAELTSGEGLLSGVRFAVDAYVNFCRVKPWQVAMASSLTELFAPDLMRERIAAFERHYGWVDPTGLDYFKSRLTLAKADSDQGLELTLAHCDSPWLQQQALGALAFKCDLLWAMLDAMMLAYGSGADVIPYEAGG
jgi:pyrroloquinoline-quinone synthase